MSGYMKDKLGALTAPMANAYANAVVFNKIENLVATFRHRKSTKTSSRFLHVNKKGNDKSYQNPVNKSRCVRVLPKHVFRKHFGRIKLKKETQQNDYTARSLCSDRARTLLGPAHAARSLRSDRAQTLLGSYVATEHTRCSRPSTHAAQSLRSDRARTRLGRYVATEHARCLSCRYVAPSTAALLVLGPPTYRPAQHDASSRHYHTPLLGDRYLSTEHTIAARIATSDRSLTLLGSLRSDRARTRSLLGCYVANEHAHAARSLRSDRARTLLGRYRPVRPQKGPPLGSILNPCRNTFRFVSIGVSVEILRRKQRPVRPQKGPPLGSHLNPRRNAFRFVSIGVFVEIYDENKWESSRLASTRYVATCQTVSRYIATCKASERSSFGFSFESSSKRFSFRLNRSFRLDFTTKTSRTLLGLLPLATPQKGPPLGCLLNPHRNAFRFVSIGVSVEILRQKQRPVSPQRVPPLRSSLNPLRNAFRFVSTGVSVEILRRKQVGLRPVRPQRGPPLRSPLNSHRNAFRFVSIGVSVEILRQKQVNLILNSLACFCSPYLHLCIHFRISIETSLVSPRLKLPLRLYDIKKKPQRPIFSHGFRLISVKISINVFTKSNLRKDIFTKSLAVKYRPNLNRTTKYRLSEGNGHVSKSAADKLEYGNQTADKPSSIDTRRPSMHTARSLRSDRASVPLGRYVATEPEPSSVAT
ncbi:hypothetical protein IGI04_040158 [Brassica rapa subsp. trilocularis]|uniref:Uncharacterized protein n=1 Tax=Brassica rapa subsp. trilocularis TaxID=1813537 RepID=A0ABQ7KM03_BRACM|nr:hypothetical protein IGI04_040158 [Brassica rapa subsp. trilocularis]